MSTVEIPCVSLPEVSKEVKITLPFGGELQAFRDFSQGIPSKCTMTFNLLLQLTPLLAAMVCPLKILQFIQKLPNIITDPFALGSAVSDLAECIPIPAKFVVTIKDILGLILDLLRCLLDEINSLLKLQLSIDLESAAGNPVFRDSLICAQKNAQLAMDHLMASIGPIQPLLAVVGTISGIANVPLKLPSLAGITPAGNDVQSIQDTVTKLDQLVTQLEQVIENLPG